MGLERKCRKMLGVLLGIARRNQSKPDERLIKKAFEVCHGAHYGQLRKSSEPYFYHPYEVAKMAAEYGCDSSTIAGCLLHDCLEDTLLPEREIRKNFGKEISEIVVGLTKFELKEKHLREEAQDAYLRKALEFSVRDPRVIIIKLFDKLHNSRTARFLGKNKRIVFVRDVWAHYVPLAHRLGIHRLEYQLEDAALEILQPKEFKDLKGKIKGMRREKEKEILKMISVLGPKLRNCALSPYFKGFGIIYSKFLSRKKPLQSIYDSAILLIVTNSTEECYGALGVVHQNFRPLPGKFKDFISAPQFHVYQALHSVVIGPKGRPVKVYIRSRQMNDLADRGIISLIGSDNCKSGEILRKKREWLRELLEEDKQDFGPAVERNYFEGRVCVYSPKGEVVSLPSGSTALDYAYSIHSDLGRHAASAIVNGKKVPLKKRLSNLGTVEIIESRNAKPKKEMLGWTITPKAKREIRKSLAGRVHKSPAGPKARKTKEFKGKSAKVLA